MGCTEVTGDRIVSTLESLWTAPLIAGRTQYICVLSQRLYSTNRIFRAEIKEANLNAIY